ncbi:MAG: MFS transporter [Labilithrix sp.]|nr:MFS transporter [Labilithrix sp.]MCW5816799.1 MFS transporter [Labilithrix sp.]
MAGRQPAIPFIVVTVIIDMMGIGLLLPVIPSLVGEFTHDVQEQTYWYGAMVFTFGFTQFLCAPMLGALSDRYGRRLVLLLSIGGLGTMFLLSGLVRSLPMLLGTRIIGGLFASNMSVANAYVADITKPEDRAKSFGLVGAAFGVGFVLGPVTGGLLGSIAIRLPFFVAAGLALLNFAYGALVLPESLPPERRKPIDLRKANPFGALVGLVRLKGVGLLVTVIALTNLSQFILNSIWVIYNEYRFGWGPREAGLSLFVVGLMFALVQGVLLGRLLRHLGEQRVVLLGLASGTCAYLMYGCATKGWMMYAISIANFLAFAVSAAINALVSKAADAREQGLAMGSLSSLNSLLTVIAPALSTPLFAHVSRYPTGDFRVGAPFFLGATFTATALAIAAFHFTRVKSAPPRPAAAP